MTNTKSNTQIEVTDLAKIGFVTFTDIGDENVYFVRASGERCYAKTYHSFEGPVSLLDMGQVCIVAAGFEAITVIKSDGEWITLEL